MLDGNLSTLGPMFYKLRNILDEGNLWLLLLEYLPFGDSNELERVARAAEQKPNTSPAEVILWRLASKGVTVSMIKKWLKEMQLERALTVLEEDEPLIIVEQPCHYVEIQEHQEIILTCQAKAFPPPEYQWFKEENELEEQTEPTLQVPHAQLSDAGLYVCRVHTYSDEKPLCIFSDISEVVVVQSFVDAMPQVHKPQLQWPLNVLLDDTKFNGNFPSVQDPQICCRQFEVQIVEPDVNILEADKKDVFDLEIVKHPISPGNVNQGSQQLLVCKVRSSLPVHYQWYCNGIKMPGETSEELKLRNLYLDTFSGEYYHCEVYTEVQRLYSRSASIHLNAFNDTTEYFAEDKVALLIANNVYDKLMDLKTPPDDVATLAELLKSIGFKVFSVMNLNLFEMKKAVRVFCDNLCKGSYGLIYYAGHGFDQFGQSYFQPKDSSESCKPNECVCVEEVLQEMQKKEPALLVLLIDMCRKLPKHYRNGEKLEPGKIFEPMVKRNVVYGYATSFLYPAYESNRTSHGYFMKHLMKHIIKKESILDILWQVKCDIEKDPAVSKRQFPWVAGSLSARRKLTDAIDPVNGLVSTTIADKITWSEIYDPPFPDIKVFCTGFSILLEFRPHKGQFCNAADLYIYLELENEELGASSSAFDVYFCFNSGSIPDKIVQHETSNDSRICCCVVEFFNLQKIENCLTGTLTVRHRSTGEEIAKIDTLPFAQPPISKLIFSECWQNMYNAENEDASLGLMSLVPPNRHCVQTRCNAHHVDSDLISFDD